MEIVEALQLPAPCMRDEVTLRESRLVGGTVVLNLTNQEPVGLRQPDRVTQTVGTWAGAMPTPSRTGFGAFPFARSSTRCLSDPFAGMAR